MAILNVDGFVLKRMIIEGAKELEKNKQLVDSLNVFPVPDGDTGTNMMLTILSAVKELEKINKGSVSEVAKTASNGSLRGARGNSGVILSQILRGFAKGLDGKTVMTTTDLGQGLLKASETAYRAVMKPKEGTILSVSKYIAEQAVEFSYDNDDLDEMFVYIIKIGHDILARTTQMLPQLKQAGVVDSGGKGFLCIIEGMYRGLKGLDDSTPISELTGVDEKILADEASRRLTSAAAMSSEEITFVYCTEFFINISKPSMEEEDTENGLKQELEKIGDSIVVVCDGRIVKIHVHTNHPGRVLETALKLGELSNLKIDNMRIQHTNITGSDTRQPEAGDDAGIQADAEEEVSMAKEEAKPVGFVAVVSGEGFFDLFKELGADEVIEGGQTMNPCTDDIIKAAEKVNAETVIILPNNKNIILAAQQAEEMCTDKKLLMVPSKTVPQGIAAIISYVDSNSIEENVEGMKEAMAEVKTGSITEAVRSTVLDDHEINEGDIICLIEGHIAHVGTNVQDAAIELVDLMVDEKSSVVTIYFGQGIEEEDATGVKTAVCEKYPELDVEIQYGAQPVYFYYISVE